ncbi:MAG: DUF2851 family protein, partial [Victivallales bacterium]|nr:DUF2851 family protein [Victivallales bacterium]
AVAEQLPPLLLCRDLHTIRASKQIYRKGKCAAFFSRLSNDRVRDILADAGWHRFRGKADQLAAEVLNRGADYTALKAVFNAMGYQHNREVFAAMFERFMEYDPETRQRFPAALLWGESGLLPAPNAPELIPELRKFVDVCWRQWGRLQRSARSPLPWRRHGQRPYHTPERRIAALIRLLEKLPLPVTGLLEFCDDSIAPATAAEAMLQQLTCSDPCWDRHTGFYAPPSRKAVVLGRQQALEITVNVILPIIYVYGRINLEAKDFSPAVIKIWEQLPPTQDNRIIKTATAAWFPDRDRREIMNSAATRQGIIHLYREYCHRCQSDCNSCLFYNSL